MIHYFAAAPITFSLVLLGVFFGSVPNEIYSQISPAIQSANNSTNQSSIAPAQTTSLIQGKYVNTVFGFEITFPERVQGTNTSLPDSTMVNVIIPTQPLPSTMIIIMKDSSKEDNSKPSLDTTSSDPCPPLSTETVNLGGKIAQATVTPCNMEASPTKTRNYNIDLGGGKTVSIIFVPNPSMYDVALPQFEEIVKTVKFTK